MIFMTAAAFLLSRQLQGETPLIMTANEESVVTHRKMALSMKF